VCPSHPQVEVFGRQFVAMRSLLTCLDERLDPFDTGLQVRKEFIHAKDPAIAIPRDVQGTDFVFQLVGPLQNDLKVVDNRFNASIHSYHRVHDSPLCCYDGRVASDSWCSMISITSG
jgi:hypothetical protein